MKYRKFGRTGLEVSAVVFGGGRVGGILIDPDDDTKRLAVRRAMDAGINWIDTAAQYGNGKSEEALGWLLPEIPEKPYLSTKFRIDTGDLSDIRGQVERSMEASLKRLNRDYVDLYQLHNDIEPGVTDRALGPDDVLRRDGVADALDALREQGLIRFAGLTGLGDAPSICKVIASGRFDSAQVYYNMLNPSAAYPVPSGWSGHDFSGIVAACREQGMAMLGIRAFAAGVIATDIRHGRESVLTRGTAIADEEARTRAVLAALGDVPGTRAQTALRFALSQPVLSCVVVGLAEINHLDQAIGAEETDPLPEDVLARLRPLYDTDFGRLP
jgi:D-threo-aldose 1-dehydrogenase